MKHYYPDKGCLTTLRIIIIFSVIILLGLVRSFIPAKFLRSFHYDSCCRNCFLCYVRVSATGFFSIKYTATETEIMKSSGVFIKSASVCKIFLGTSITSGISSPFWQRTGLNLVVFFVYGGQLRLLFLKQSDAQEILRCCMPAARNWGGSNVPSNILCVYLNIPLKKHMASYFSDTESDSECAY